MRVELAKRSNPWGKNEKVTVLSWLITNTIDAVGYESRHLVFERFVPAEDLVTMRLQGSVERITNLRDYCIIDNEDHMHEFYQNGKVTLRRKVKGGFIFEYDQHTHTKVEPKIIKEPGLKSGSLGTSTK